MQIVDVKKIKESGRVKKDSYSFSWIVKCDGKRYVTIPYTQESECVLPEETGIKHSINEENTDS